MIWARSAALAVAYFAASEASWRLSVPHSWFVPFWMPAGFLACYLLLNPLRTWPATLVLCAAASLAYDRIHGIAPWAACLGALANTAGALTGAVLYLRVLRRAPQLLSLGDFAGLATFSGLVGPVVGATLGCVVVLLPGAKGTYAGVWPSWWTSDAMGVMVALPFLMSWFSGSWPRRPSAARAAEAAALVVGVVAGAWLLIVRGPGIQSSRVVLLLPFVVWAALRFGIRGASAVALVLAVVVTYATTHYLVGLSPEEVRAGHYLTTLNAFLIVASLVGLVPALAVTERDRSEGRLRESEYRFRGFVENASVGIYRTSPQGRFLLANEATLKIMGYRSFEELSTLSFEDKANQREYPRAEFRRQIEEQGSVRGWETWWTRPDGSRVFVRESATAIRDASGVVMYYDGILEDISQSKKTEQALVDSEERFRTLSSAAFEGIVIVEDSHWVDVNDQALAMLGYERHEAVGRPVTDFVRPEFRAEVSSRIADRDEQSYEIELVRKDGTTFPVEARAKEVRAGGRRVRMTALRDITEKRAQEQRQRNIEQQMRTMQKMEALGTLAGGIAHDFNNILTGILGNLQLAGIELPRDHGAYESVASAEQAARRARDLVGRILSFSSPGQKRMSVASLGATVLEAVELLRAGLPSQVDIRAEIDPRCPAVAFDPGQIHQVIMNLGTNSAQAMDARGGVISIRLRSEVPDRSLIERHPKVTPAHRVRLEVADNGGGIPASVMQRIFEPFFTTKDFGKGTGLGLAMVHTVVTAHEGAVTVESTEGVGTTFSLYFPVAAAEAPASPAPESPQASSLHPFGQGRRILLVDDEDPARTVAGKLLSRLGFDASCHAGPREALEAFRTAPASFAAVISDVAMPGMTGIELAQELYRVRPDVPVLLVSGNFRIDPQRHRLGPNIRGMIQKPFDVNDLVSAVRQAIG